MVTTEARGDLAKNAIGLREVLFQSITHMAPGAAVAFSIIVGANFAAGALPLSILFALVGCLFVALSIGQLAKHLPSAAGFATYTSRGLHPSVGFMVAWGYALAEALVAPLLYLIFANVVAGTLAAEFGWSFDTGGRSRPSSRRCSSSPSVGSASGSAPAPERCSACSRSSSSPRSRSG